MTAILKNDPPALLPGAVPSHLDRVVHRCLEKSPSQRFQSAKDIAFALEAMAAVGIDASASTVVLPPARRRWRPLALGAAVAGRCRHRCGGDAPGRARTIRRRELRGPLVRSPADHQRAVHARWQDDRLQRDAGRIVAGAVRRQSHGRGATAARACRTRTCSRSRASGELAVIVAPRFLDQRLYARHAGPHDHRQLAACRGRRRARGRLVAGRIRDGDRARPRQQPRSPRVPGRHDAARSQRLLEQSTRVARRQPRRVRRTSAALRRSRLGQGRRPRRHGDHADRGALRRAGAGLDAGRQPPSSSPATPSRRRCCSRCRCRAAGGAPAAPVFGVPARFIVFDVATDGRWLAVREDLSVGVRARVPGQETERDLSWLGSTGAQALSADGEWLLMVDVGERAGPNYGVVLRKTDASQTIRLGEGHAQKLSPDGQWAAAIIAAPAQLLIYPTGPGEADPDRHRTDGAPHLGRMVPGWQAAARVRIGGVTCAPLLRVDRDGVGAAAADPGRRPGHAGARREDAAARDARWRVRAVVDRRRATRSVQGLRSGDRQIAWSRDSQSVYVQRGFQAPATVERVALATGARSIVRTLTPDGVGAITALYVMDWVDDGRWYAYYYTSLPSTLFVVHDAIQLDCRRTGGARHESRR